MRVLNRTEAPPAAELAATHDLVIAAEKVTPEAVHFFLREARGKMCLAMPEERALAILEKERGVGLDPDCLDALLTVLDRSAGRRPADRAA